MSFNYKDLTYIRAALQSYEAELSNIKEDECGEEEFSEAQDDIMYLSRLIALTNRQIEDWESKGPSLNPVRDPE
jgi:hypothetical protein